MKIKNTGKMRIRLDKILYILPGEELDVSVETGKWAIKTHKDIIDKTPAPYVSKFKSKSIPKIDNE
jgi:hypothetical protein